MTCDRELPELDRDGLSEEALEKQREDAMHTNKIHYPRAGRNLPRMYSQDEMRG